VVLEKTGCEELVEHSQTIKEEEKMKRYNRKHKVTRHHILPRSRNGNDKPDNIWMLPREKHDSWHNLFGLRTIDEAISYLRELKERRKNRS